MPEVELHGCTPEPLASYLKGLGLFRILAEQFDSNTRAWWRQDTLHVESKLTSGELVEAILTQYEPTPVVAPWNGGSGFFPKDYRAAREAIETSTEGRLSDYRATIARARGVLRDLGIREKPNKDQKPAILAACRAWFPDRAVPWLDAAYVLTSEDPHYPPLLGTGGNDGRLEFANNYMQRLVDALALGEESAGRRRGKAHDRRALAEGWLKSALFATEAPPLVSASVGQFHPGGVGGPNATQGFDGQSLVNPWEFVLLIEGALLFAGAVARRLGVDSEDKAAFPFTVSGVGTGYGTAVVAEYGSSASRAEIWVPLWDRPALLAEVRQVLSEGRAQWGRRQARTGVDFARAVVSLGVDRGISEFRRYGLLQRSGKAFLANPLGRLRVQPRPEVQLMHELDGWLDAFRRTCTSGSNVPASLWAALRSVDEAILAFATHGRERLLDVLVGVGEAEQVIASRPRARGTFLPPVPGLNPAWYGACFEETVEFRLAAALASVSGSYVARASAPREGERRKGPAAEDALPPIRAYLEPVSRAGTRWVWAPESRSAVWGPGSLAKNLGRVLGRRAMEAMDARIPHLPVHGAVTASLHDVDRFLRGECDDQRVERLLKGLSLIDWTRYPDGSGLPLRAGGTSEAGVPVRLPRVYALLKLVSLDRPLVLARNREAVSIRPEPSLFSLLRANRVGDACELATKRLKSSGFVPMVRSPRDLAHGIDGERLLGALLIPIWETRLLAGWMLRAPADDGSTAARNEAVLAGS